MAIDQFSQDSKDVMNALLKRAKELVDGINTLDRPSEDYTSYYGYLKDFPINSGCLCDDILQAAHNDNDAVLLAMNGTRGLLEDAINVDYLASKETEQERIAVALDWFRISNDRQAQKNELDGKNVANRAKAAGKNARSLYYGEYADFCNYVHGTAARSLLNIPSHRSLLAQKAVVASIKAYANIITCTEKIIGKTTPKELTATVSSYLAKYKMTVMEALLPKLDDEGRPVHD